MSISGKNDIEDMFLKASVDSRLACLKIFEIIKDNSLDIDEAASAIDSSKIKINACQMGLFGCKGGKSIPVVDDVPATLKDKINSNLENGKLSCIKAWDIAAELNLRKSEVASACEMLKIKINRCQLKAF